MISPTREITQMHALLISAKRGQFRASPELPPDALYEPEAGVWRVNGRLLATMPNFELNTKKWDLETAEDHKGT
jgi:hypothetical protein